MKRIIFSVIAIITLTCCVIAGNAQSDTYFVAKDDIILVDYIFDIGIYFEENGTFIPEPGPDQGHQQVGTDFQVTVGKHEVVAPFEGKLFGMKLGDIREVKAKSEEIPSYVDQFGGKDYYWQITLTEVIYDASTDTTRTTITTNTDPLPVDTLGTYAILGVGCSLLIGGGAFLYFLFKPKPLLDSTIDLTSKQRHKEKGALSDIQEMLSKKTSDVDSSSPKETSRLKKRRR